MTLHIHCQYRKHIAVRTLRDIYYDFAPSGLAFRELTVISAGLHPALLLIALSGLRL